MQLWLHVHRLRALPLLTFKWQWNGHACSVTAGHIPNEGETECGGDEKPCPRGKGESSLIREVKETLLSGLLLSVFIFVPVVAWEAGVVPLMGVRGRSEAVGGGGCGGNCGGCGGSGVSCGGSGGSCGGSCGGNCGGCGSSGCSCGGSYGSFGGSGGGSGREGIRKLLN